MKITKRQLRRIIKEAAGPSLESLFAKGAPYDNSDRTKIVIDDMAKQSPGLEKKIRKILGPLSSGDDDKGNFHYYIGKHLNLAARQWSLGSPEWVKYASDLIRQAGIEREFINYAPSVPIKWETPLTKQQTRAMFDGGDTGPWKQTPTGWVSENKASLPVMRATHMKITKRQLRRIIREELEESASYPLENVPQDSVTAGELGKQVVVQTKRAPNQQEEASQLFGDRMNIDISKHAYRIGQHLGIDHAKLVAKALNRAVPHAGAQMLLGAQHGFGDEE